MVSKTATVIVLAVLLILALIGVLNFGYGTGGYTTTVTTAITTTATTMKPVTYTTTVTTYMPTTVASTTMVVLTETVTKTVTRTATVTYTTTAPQGQVSATPLIDKNYFTTLLNHIEKATTSIHVIMYVVKYDPKEYNDPVNQILNGLASAYQRGVDVKVIVDDETYKSYPQTIEFLKSHEIPVKLDEKSSKRTHAKIIIIDGKIVFIGSHNWTESALTYNHEASVLINSQEIAKAFEEYFQNIWDNGRTV